MVPGTEHRGGGWTIVVDNLIWECPRRSGPWCDVVGEWPSVEILKSWQKLYYAVPGLVSDYLLTLWPHNVGISIELPGLDRSYGPGCERRQTYLTSVTHDRR